VPRISTFYGIVISMYHSDHPPPHFHAWYSGHKAEFKISAPALIAGKLPPRAERLVLEWARQHVAELLVNWQRARSEQPLATIDPLP
jgi:hypothetical protein